MTAAHTLLDPTPPALTGYLMSFLDVMTLDTDTVEFESASNECRRLLGTMDRACELRLAGIIGAIRWPEIRTIH